MKTVSEQNRDARRVFMQGNPNLPEVSVVMLNWNGWKETVKGLEALFESDYPNFNLVLLDNGSTDDSLDSLFRWFNERGHQLVHSSGSTVDGKQCSLFAESDRIKILRSATNVGFTGGNNRAITYALEKYSPKYVFLLNNDAILEPNCLQNCVRLAEEHDATIVGALIKSTDRTAVIFSGADPYREVFAAQTPRRLESLPEYWETGRVEASAELVSSDFLRQRIETYGYVLDPGFFIYCEETDLALSALSQGKKIMMTKHAVAYHGVAQSMGGWGNPMQYYYITRNRVFLAQRWLPVVKKVLFNIYYPVSRSMRIIQHV
ncbi:MAG TPA: glycosyltransferase family 2 protein, partial [Bacteroidota bacterium]|nr:glycosyltransferase family 2 protein [Bacteroidota bacterium]